MVNQKIRSLIILTDKLPYMKRILFVVLLAIGLPTISCKKEKEYCWTCTDLQGNDFNGNTCGKTESDIQKIRDQGYGCSKN
jgi:hypothetical protein